MRSPTASDMKIGTILSRSIAARSCLLKESAIHPAQGSGGSREARSKRFEEISVAAAIEWAGRLTIFIDLKAFLRPARHPGCGSPCKMNSPPRAHLSFAPACAANPGSSHTLLNAAWPGPNDRMADGLPE